MNPVLKKVNLFIANLKNLISGECPERMMNECGLQMKLIVLIQHVEKTNQDSMTRELNKRS